MKTIASVGGEMPIDLLEATGRYAGPLGWNIDRATPVADQWIESRFAPWVRSVLEDWAAGALDGHSHIVFSRGDDNAQRLYYYVCELRRQGLIAGPEPLIFDAARIGRATSLARTVAGVRRLAAQLGLDDVALEDGIAATNAVRENRHPRIESGAGSEPFDVAQDVLISGSMPRSLSGSQDEAWMLKQVQHDGGGGGDTVLLAGTLPPDERLHKIVAQSGRVAVGETLSDNWADPGPMVTRASGDPAAAIAAQVYARATGPRAFFDRAGRLVELARGCGASGVILWLIEEEEGLVWHVPAQRRALEDAGIPHLVLTRRDWAARDGVADEIAAFLCGLPV